MAPPSAEAPSRETLRGKLRDCPPLGEASGSSRPGNTEGSGSQRQQVCPSLRRSRSPTKPRPPINEPVPAPAPSPGDLLSPSETRRPEHLTLPLLLPAPHAARPPALSRPPRGTSRRAGRRPRPPHRRHAGPCTTTSARAPA